MLLPYIECTPVDKPQGALLTIFVSYIFLVYVRSAAVDKRLPAWLVAARRELERSTEICSRFLAAAPQREHPMTRSIDRFLTTHTGSLPRPDDLVRIMYAKEEGKAVDGAELATHVRNAVAEVVARQKELGIDIINDGEMSKPSYATYVKD